MTNVIEEFGLNAGRIWNALNSCGPLTEDQLMEETSLKKNELTAAIGWLARENKICKDGEMYKLGDTNLTVKIGGDAGKIWNLLRLWNEVNAAHIPDFIDIESSDVYSALGWLAREGKIQLTKGGKSNNK